jgi:hypothetical protein
LKAAGDEQPVPGRIYRCGVCRLPLILSDDSTRMIVMPFVDKGTGDDP